MSGAQKGSRVPPEDAGSSAPEAITARVRSGTGPHVAFSDSVRCDRCGAEMFRMHAVWRCPACGFKTDCCGW